MPLYILLGDEVLLYFILANRSHVKVKFVLNSNRFVIYKEFSKLEKFSILFVGHGPKPVLPRNQPRLVFFFLGGPTFLSFFSSRERPTTAGMIGPISARLLGRYSPTQATV
jgi:hypothetical protein